MTASAGIAQRLPRRPAAFRRPADRGERLARVLTAQALRAGCTIRLSVAAVEPWRSATFSGSVVLLDMDAVPGAALSAWLAKLPETDVPLGPDLIADIAVEKDRLRVLLCLDAANT